MPARIGALLLGIAGTLAGLLLIGVGLLNAIAGQRTPTQFMLVATTLPLGVLLLELGLAAAWLTRQVGRGQAGRPATLPPWWLIALIFILVVGAGAGALALDQWWLFLPFATLAIFAPIVGAGRLGLPYDGERPGWARLLPAFAWGALVTPLLAIVVQGLAAVGAIGAALLGLALGNQRTLEILAAMLRGLQGRTLTTAQTEALARLVAGQPIVLLLGAFVLVFVGPVSEELLKFGGAFLFGRTRADRPARDSTLTVFLLGLAAGLGFAATENIFYATQGGATGWPGAIVVRAITPLMHGTASALFALGWARQRRAPQGWSLLHGAMLAIGLHAAWNLCAGLLIVAALFVGAGGMAAAAAALLLLLALAGMGGLLLASVATLLRLRRTLAAESLTPADPEPLPGDRRPTSPPNPPATIPESAWNPPLAVPGLLPFTPPPYPSAND